MNVILVLTCLTCEQDIDCRVGFSNRRIQPLQFACPHCSSLVGLTLDTTRAPSYDLTFRSADQLPEHQYSPFDGRNPFVDLHLDFPVAFGEYKQGHTPYLAAVKRVNQSASHTVPAPLRMAHLNVKLGQLNFFAEKADQVRTTIRLYFGANKQLFKRRVEQLLEIDTGPSLLPKDVNAALYKLISSLFNPFIHSGSTSEFVEQMTEMIKAIAQGQPRGFNAFIDRIHDTGFLLNVQRDCIELYPEIYDAELALRPALFLDIVSDDGNEVIAGRVSVDDFSTYKDLYKDLCEVFNRQLILVAGLNNVIHRGGHDAFAPLRGQSQPLGSLDKFADKTLSEKFKYLDECWFLLDRNVVNAGMRNAIAHHITEYDEIRQKIVYFPEREGIRQEQAEQMSFLAFMRLILDLFREVHYLHHVIKCLLNYEFIIRGPHRAGLPPA